MISSVLLKKLSLRDLVQHVPTVKKCNVVWQVYILVQLTKQ